MTIQAMAMRMMMKEANQLDARSINVYYSA